MEDSADNTGLSRRTWSFALAGVWAALGLWAMSHGRTWLGLAQVGLAVAYVAAAHSPRVEAFLDAPLFRRKR